jgi:hypothetical protein
MSVDPSQALEPFRSYVEVLAWLWRILARTLVDVVKHYDRDKRAVDLERSQEDDLDRSASGMAAWLAADQTSPAKRPNATRSCFD